MNANHRRLDKIAAMVSPGIDPATVAEIDRELIKVIREAEKAGADWRGAIRQVSGDEPYCETFIAEMEGALQ